MSSALRERALLAYTFLLLGTTVVSALLAPPSRWVGGVTGIVIVTAWVGWVICHSALTRGASMTAQFFLIAIGMAFSLNTGLPNLTDVMHHSLQPQIFGVAPQSFGAWIAFVYAGFAVTQALLTAGETWTGALIVSIVAALATTALDLTAEPVAVRLGFFTYDTGGAFMPEVEGVNGVHGIPLANYLVWMAAATVTYLAMWLAQRGIHAQHPENSAGRGAALLFYLTLFCTVAIPALQLGDPQLMLIGGLPVTLVCLLVVRRYLDDRRARETSMRRGRERARVSSLVERRLASHRR